MDRLGGIFVEIMGDADPFVAALSGALDDATKEITRDLTGAMSEAADDAGGVLADGMGAAGQQMVLDLGAAGETAGAEVASGVQDAVDLIRFDTNIFSPLVDAAGSAAGSVGDTIGSIPDVLPGVERSFAQAAADIGSTLVTGIVGAADGIASAFGSGIDWFDGVVTAAETAANNAASALAGLGERIDDSTLVQGVNRALDRAGQGLLRTAETTGVAAGGVLAGALTSGFGRLRSLENAEQMLKQMGISADDSAMLMAGLNEVLLGTSFMLQDGATAMAGLVSAGLDLDRVPGLMGQITDAAAFGQAPLNEIAQIWQRIGLNQRVTGMQLQELSNRNIPIYGLLQEALNMTQEEVLKLASSGELSADMFYDAWDAAAGGFGATGIAIEGAAQSMGDTTEGAIGNMGGAMGRFGADILGPFWEGFREAADGIRGAFDEMGDAAEGVVQALGESEGWASFLDFMRTLPERVGSAVESLSGLGSIVAPLGAAFAALSARGLSQALGSFGRLIPVISPITAIIATLILTNDELRDAFFAIVEAVMPLVTAIAGTLAGTFSALLDAILPVATTVLEMLLPAFEWVGENADWLAPILLSMLGTFKVLGPAVSTAVTAFRGVGGALGIVSKAFGVLKTVILANPLLLLATIIVGIVVAIWYFRDEIMAAIGAAWEWLKNATQTVWDWLVGVWDGLLETISGAWNSVLEWFRELPGRIIDALVGLATTVVEWIIEHHPLAILWRHISEIAPQVWEAITGVVDSVVEIIAGWVDSIAEFLEPLWDALTFPFRFAYELIVEIWTMLSDWVSGHLETFFAMVSGVWDRIVDWTTSAWDNIYNAVVQPVIDFVARVITTVVGWSATLLGWWNTIRDNVVRVFTNLKDRVVGVFETVRDTVVGVWVTVYTRIVETVSNIRRWLTDTWQGIRDTIAGAVRTIRDRITGAFTSAKDSVTDTIGGLLDTVRGIPGRILSALGSLGRTLWQSGKDMIQGLIDGAGSMLRNLGKFLLDKLPGWIRRPFERAMGIASPSRVFADYGQDLIAGLVQGIERNAVDATSAIDQVALDMARRGSGLEMTLNGGTLPTPVDRHPRSGGGIGPITVNVTIEGDATRHDATRIAEQVSETLIGRLSREALVR